MNDERNCVEALVEDANDTCTVHGRVRIRRHGKEGTRRVRNAIWGRRPRSARGRTSTRPSNFFQMRLAENKAHGVEILLGAASVKLGKSEDHEGAVRMTSGRELRGMKSRSCFAEWAERWRLQI